jgi:hypothetical protein
MIRNTLLAEQAFLITPKSLSYSEEDILHEQTYLYYNTVLNVNTVELMLWFL